jgi:Flp pilus assembly protein CpaB
MVLTAAHDLAAGVVVGAGDVRRAPYDPAGVPEGTLPAAAVVGRTTTGPVRAGEPITDARLVEAGLLRGYPGLVAVPVRIGDPGAVRLLRAGDRVDLLAADPQGEQPATTLGEDVPVLAVPRSGEADPGLTTGALVVVGLPPAGARQAADASVSAFLSVVLTR